MANVTITTSTNWAPDLWSRMILEVAHRTLVNWDLHDNSLESEVKSGGDSIRKPNLAEIASATLSSMTGTITFTANTEGLTTLSLNTLTYSAVKVDSAARIQSIPGLLDKYTKELGRSVAQGLDSTIAALYTNYSTVKGVDNVAITDQVMRDSIQYLNESNAPQEDRYLVVSPAGQMDLYNIEKYVNSLTATLAAFEGNFGAGYFGTVMNVNCFMSNALSAGAAGKIYGMFQKESILVAKQNEITTELRQPHDEIADAVRTWVIHGNVEQRDTFGVEIDAR